MQNKEKTRPAKLRRVTGSPSSTHPLTFDTSSSIQELHRFLTYLCEGVGGWGMGDGAGAANWGEMIRH